MISCRFSELLSRPLCHSWMKTVLQNQQFVLTLSQTQVYGETRNPAVETTLACSPTEKKKHLYGTLQHSLRSPPKQFIKNLFGQYIRRKKANLQWFCFHYIIGNCLNSSQIYFIFVAQIYKTKFTKKNFLKKKRFIGHYHIELIFNNTKLSKKQINIYIILGLHH